MKSSISLVALLAAFATVVGSLPATSEDALAVRDGEVNVAREISQPEPEAAELEARAPKTTGNKPTKAGGIGAKQTGKTKKDRKNGKAAKTGQSAKQTGNPQAQKGQKVQKGNGNKAKSTTPANPAAT